MTERYTSVDLDNVTRLESQLMDQVYDGNIRSALIDCLRAFRGGETLVDYFFASMDEMDWAGLRLEVVRNRNFPGVVLGRIFTSFVGRKISEIKVRIEEDGGCTDGQFTPIKSRLSKISGRVRGGIRRSLYS